jgi:pyruvate/2-oxoglutarate dehydrogenase complex dihydrolipoamide acyltransferase (E2) component
VSNLGGPFGIKQFCAIVNPPQSAILAIGSGNVFPVDYACPPATLPCNCQKDKQ